MGAPCYAMHVVAFSLEKILTSRSALFDPSTTTKKIKIDIGAPNNLCKTDIQIHGQVKREKQMHMFLERPRKSQLNYELFVESHQNDDFFAEKSSK